MLPPGVELHLPLPPPVPEPIPVPVFFRGESGGRLMARRSKFLMGDVPSILVLGRDGGDVVVVVLAPLA